MNRLAFTTNLVLHQFLVDDFGVMVSTHRRFLDKRRLKTTLAARFNQHSILNGD